MKNTWKLIVLDIAGTTIQDNGAVGKAFQKALRVYGCEVPLESINPLMGYAKPEAIRMILGSMGRTVGDSVIRHIHQRFIEEMIGFYRSAPEVKPMHGAADTMAALRERGIRVALNTGFSRDIARVIVERTGWMAQGIIDDYIASDEVSRGRPHSFMIHALMDRAGTTEASQVVKVGDTEVDINEGRNSGCGLVVAVTTGAFTRDQLQTHRPDHIIDDLLQLLPLMFDHV